MVPDAYKQCYGAVGCETATFLLALELKLLLRLRLWVGNFIFLKNFPKNPNLKKNKFMVNL
jgi:hypothetical protein